MEMSARANIFEAVQLNDELSHLRSSLPKARSLIDHAEWGKFKNKELAMLLLELKDTTYDAEDLLREFNDQELRQKMENADGSRAGQLLSSSLNPEKSLIHGSKTRVKETQSRLDKAMAEIHGALSPLGPNVEPVQLMPETSSVIGAPEVLGRDEERDLLIEMLGVTIGSDHELDQVIELLDVPLTKGGRSAGASGKRAASGTGVASTSRAKRLKGKSSRVGPAVATETDCTGNVSVLAIVGIGGVGKTTLAQFIYNDARVKAHFGVRIWVCVSDLFNKRRITKEIIESISGEDINSSLSLNALQEELMGHLKGQKFLLVLDDIWPNANDEWEAFYARLRHGLEGSMVLVTTRFQKVADLVTTIKPVELEGLPTNIFWEFFKKCAFGKELPESYPHLQDIGQSIADRLCGSPLAAKTLGRLLNMELTERHWRTIQNSELWELPHQENDILPALQLSYLYLPQELKRCFVFCSMFPKDYSFKRDVIVDIWVAQGFVAAGGNVRLEDMGSRYLDDLRSMFLFRTDPKFPEQSRYVMHGLIHDMAQSVSVDECFLMQDLNYQNQRRMPHTVRHISIEVNNDALRRMGDIQPVNKLRSLWFGTRLEVEVPWFSLLSNILFLSLKGCKLVKLPESICGLSSLRYLDISHSRIKELPEKFRCLYSLQVFDARHSSLQTIHQDVTKLVNLRRLALPAICSEKLSTLSGLGNLSSLRNLSYFTARNENGRRISEMKGMNQLTGQLSIRSIANVWSMEEAAEARLVEKQYLKELVLHWRGWCHSLMSSENGVLEALRPPPRIERLRVQGFGGDKPPSWLNPENLPTLMILEVSRCRFLRYLPTPFPSLEQLVVHLVGIEALTSSADGTPAGSTGDDRTQHGSSSSSSIAHLPLTCLSYLHLYGCGNLTSLNQFLSPEYLPSIKSIEIDSCGNLVSLPVHKFVGFVCLQDLKIQECCKLMCPREMVLPPSLRRLSIHNCGELDKSFPGCLEDLTSLTLLKLSFCGNVESIPLSLIDTSMLKCLLLCDCQKLSSIGGLHALSSIQHVRISGCRKLTEIQQPFQKKGLRTKKEKELLKFVGPSRTAVTIDPSLNDALPPAPAPTVQQEKQERLMGKQPVNYNTLEMESDKRVVLQRTLSSMHDLIEHAECWVHKDAVSTLLQKAKDAVYCAEDILDELNYHELQDKVEGNTVQSQFPEFCDIKMEEIKGKLDHLISQMGHLGLHDTLELFYIDKSISLEANLFPEEQTIFGHEKELMELIDLLDLQENTPAGEQVRGASIVPEVLPIVGGGGIGKTTLAHHIVSEKRVRDHFDLLIWLSVSDGFDEKKLIKRLIFSVAESEMKSDDLSSLQRILSNGIIHHSRRFLLVLDDVQEDVCREDCHRWKSFLDPLKCAKPGSTVLVITRSLKVANAEHLGTKKPLVLEGLPEETLWEFFRMQVFRSDYSNSHPVLERIGRSLVARLNGSPLGAKILGCLLSLKLDAGYWKSILESELWELPHQEEISIGPALELSYQYLPFLLKRCFSFCSMYPKDYEFDKETIVDSWIAVGLVEPYQSTLAVHVGHVYFQQMVNRSFFQKAPTSSGYVMHDLLLEMAQLKSRNECFVVKGRCDLSRIPPNVRHVSVLGNSDLSSNDLESLHKYKTLRSVLCICIDSDIMTTTVLKTWFCHLTNIRMLRFKSSQLEELPDNVGNLIHLRYLDISACDFDKLPDSFWRLYKLEILDAQNCKFNDVPKDIIKLINLQRVRLKDDLISQFGCVPEIGKLALLQEMPYYTVDDNPGRGIQELKNMIHLQGRLEISGLRNVMSKEQAAEAALDKKIYLHTLILSWHESIRPEKHNSSQEMEVLEGLRPSSKIKHLEVKFYMGTGFHPSWLREDELSSLASLSINSCPNVAILFVEPSELGSSRSSSSGFQSLTKLSITWCRRLKNLDSLLRPEYLPAIKAIRISNCEDLVSLPTESLGGFVHLEDLEVCHCWSLNWEPGLVLPCSLKALRLEACGEFSDPTLSCLRNLAALATLDLQFCPRVESIPAQIWSGLPSLENLKIFCCQGLNSIGGGSESIARVKNVDIRHCPKLEELKQPFRQGWHC